MLKRLQSRGSRGRTVGASLVGSDVHGRKPTHVTNMQYAERPLFRRGGLDRKFSNGHQACELLISESAHRYPNRVMFKKAVESTCHALIPVFDRFPQYAWAMKHMIEPERLVQFRVPWTDDEGNPRMSRAWRVQYSSALGPYVGGFRFHRLVNLDEMQALAFEQILMNSLTGMDIGAARGGSDFNPVGKTNTEIRNFCRSLMIEMAKFIGPDRDMVMGDLGVSAKELGYMFGRYKRLTGNYHPIMSKYSAANAYRQKADGMGAVLYAQHALKGIGNVPEGFEGKRVVITGSGNVALSIAEKLIDLGAKVICLSDSTGYVVEEDGFDLAKLEGIRSIKATNPKGWAKRMSEYLKLSTTARYYLSPSGSGKRGPLLAGAGTGGSEGPMGREPSVGGRGEPRRSSASLPPASSAAGGAGAKGAPTVWDVPCDYAFASMTTGIFDEENAQRMIKSGCKGLFMGRAGGVELGALNAIKAADIMFSPALASNAGGVVASGLEVTRQVGSLGQMDENQFLAAIEDTIEDIYEETVETAEEFNVSGDLHSGSVIAAFIRVAKAMQEQGHV